MRRQLGDNRVSRDNYSADDSGGLKGRGFHYFVARILQYEGLSRMRELVHS